MQTILHTKNLVFAHDSGEKWEFPDLQILEKDKLLILGASGSGKTTLVHLLCGLLSSKSGDIFYRDQSYTGLSTLQKDKLRGKYFGLVLQRPHFIRSISVLENIRLAQKLGNKKNDEGLVQALLTQLNIDELIDKKTYQLSEGEKQRVSIARALACKPEILFADEPTSALDDHNCNAVIRLLFQTADEFNCSLVIITHDARIKPYFSRNYEI